MAKILIVDDSAFSRSIVQKAVAAAGHETLEASSGAAAAETYQAEKPDLILMDLLMPDMDGMDVIRQIRESAPEARFIACTSDKQLSRRQEAEELGACAFIAKPVDADALLEAIAAALGE